MSTVTGPSDKKIWDWEKRNPPISENLKKIITEEQSKEVERKVIQRKKDTVDSVYQSSGFFWNYKEDSIPVEKSTRRIEAGKSYERDLVIEETAKTALKRHWFVEWFSPFENTQEKEIIPKLKNNTAKSEKEFSEELRSERYTCILV